MKLEVNGMPNFRLNGTLLQVCADTKGAREIGGFMAPSANKFCCLCLISRNEIRFKITYRDFSMRNRINHDTLAREGGDSATGIKRFCLLNESRYFHFVENFSFDILHDFFEGAIPFFESYFTLLHCK
jgi:hypothetical protein